MGRDAGYFRTGSAGRIAVLQSDFFLSRAYPTFVAWIRTLLQIVVKRFRSVRADADSPCFSD